MLTNFAFGFVTAVVVVRGYQLLAALVERIMRPPVS